jgi:histidinol-phosphatase (PHP family)
MERHTAVQGDTNALLRSIEAIAGGCSHSIAIAFTEHVDFTAWTLPIDAEIRAGWKRFVTANVMRPPELDIDGYLESIRRCRQLFPGLQILSGVELSEPHWHPQQTANLLAAGGFDRVISSVHAGLVDGGFFEISGLFDVRVSADVVREYLAEVVRMIEGFDVAVLAHSDYPVRYWPAKAGRRHIAATPRGL